MTRVWSAPYPNDGQNIQKHIILWIDLVFRASPKNYISCTEVLDVKLNLVKIYFDFRFTQTRLVHIRLKITLTKDNVLRHYL